MGRGKKYTPKEVIQLLNFLHENYHPGGMNGPWARNGTTPYASLSHEQVLKEFDRSKLEKKVTS